MAWVECEWATLIVFGNLKLAFQARKAWNAIKEEWRKPMGKAVLINAVKHFLLNFLSVAGAAGLGWLLNDTTLMQALHATGLPDAVILAISPFIHSILVMLQKKFLPGLADANSQPSK